MSTSIRTTTNGTTGTTPYRFTAGQPDALNTPSGGFVPGKPPFVWMTGGGTIASADPSTIGMDVVLDAFCAAGYSVAQPNVPWALGGPGITGPPASGLVDTIHAINDAVAWQRANLGCTMQPPVVMGVSNGWVCAIIYARDNPVSAAIGILCVTAGKDGYLSEDATLRGLGLRERMETAWNVGTNGNPAFPALPVDPKFSPYDDIASYPTSLYRNVQMWYSANDPLLISQQMSFGQRIRAEVHNVGDYGHLGAFFDGSQPVDHTDPAKMVAFVNARV